MVNTIKDLEAAVLTPFRKNETGMVTKKGILIKRMYVFCDVQFEP